MPAPISVIIPCYRAAHGVSRAVGSVLAQTCAPAEIVLIDDGSDDSTLATLRMLEAQHKEPPIRVIALERNCGPGPARNKGWSAATQRYIAFLDHDDSWHAQKLEIQYEWMNAHPEVTLTGHRIVPGIKGTASQFSPDNCRAHRVSPWSLLISNRFETSSVMLRSDVPIRFDPSLRRIEDYGLWLDIVLRGYAAWRLELPLAVRHKAVFGEAGLSAELWAMERWELNVYRRVWNERFIRLPTLALLFAWSLAKFVRRVIITRLRAAATPARRALPPS